MANAARMGDTMKKIVLLLLLCVFLSGCNEAEDDGMVWEVREQTFQLLLKNACTEHNHTQPTIHHPDLDGEMCDYVFDGEEWKEIMYDEDEIIIESTEHWEINLETNWIISNELIERLNLKPHDTGFDLAIEGEDGKTYSWCGVLEAHMDWVEEKLEAKDEEYPQYYSFKNNRIRVDKPGRDGVHKITVEK